MTESSRMPSWRERENNKRRERRRRAIAAKIYTGLRMYGNFELPKHCDNNEVLKALCKEAGWVVEEDGTTYRKGCKPTIDQMDSIAGSASMSMCSSYQTSPQASYNPSPSASSFPSPAHYMAAFANNLATSNPDPNSLIPWLKNLSSNATTTTNSSCHTPTFPYHIPGCSISAPVTPPTSSPTCTTPRARNEWEDSNAGPPCHWPGIAQSYSLSSSTPQSPGRQVLPEPAWLANIQGTQTSPTSPTFSLVSSNPFGCKDGGGGGSRMWTPGQSGTCSPAVAAGSDGTSDVPMTGPSSEFAFGSCSANGMVNAWEGERIHEECVPEPDDLELTLGGSKTR